MKKIIITISIFFLGFFFTNLSHASAATLYFNAATNTNWNTLTNWWTDAGFSIQAGSLPTTNDDVIISGNVLSNSGSAASVNTMTVNGTSILGNFPITVANGATFNGTSKIRNDFLALSQTSRSWQGMATAPNGNVYATVADGDIYMQTAGTGNFVALSQTSRDWRSITVTLNGNITDNGGANITARGFNYGTSISYGTTVTQSSGPYSTGTFSTDLINLNCGQPYHYRAFATNAVGTTNGTDLTFSTANCSAIGGGGLITSTEITPPTIIPPPTTGTTLPPIITPEPIITITPPTIPTCTLTVTLRQGNKGEEVKCLQTKLNLLVDGIFGKKTKATVILFQKAHNLTPDGVVGKKTRGEMNG